MKLQPTGALGKWLGSGCHVQVGWPFSCQGLGTLQNVGLRTLQNVRLKKQLGSRCFTPRGPTAGTQQWRHKPSPTDSEPCPFSFARPALAMPALACRPSCRRRRAYLRPLLGPAVKGVPHHPRLGPGNAALHEFIIDVLLHEGPGAGAAALALVEEEGKVGLLHSPVHCGEGDRGQRGDMRGGRSPRHGSPTPTAHTGGGAGARWGGARAWSE